MMVQAGLAESPSLVSTVALTQGGIPEALLIVRNEGTASRKTRNIGSNSKPIGLGLVRFSD